MKSIVVTITTVLTLFFMISCNLVTPKTDETSKDIPKTGTVPKGIWYSIDSSTVISFSDPDIFILEYSKEFKYIDTMKMTFTVSASKDTLFVTDPNSDSVMTIAYSYSGDTLVAKTDSETMKFLAYTGSMPPKGWDIITGTAGTHVGGIPKDAWMNLGSEQNNLLIFGTNKVVMFQFDSYQGTLKLDTVTFTASASHDTLFAVMSDGTKDTVLIEFKGDTLIITADEVMKYLPYTGPILPESWKTKSDTDTGMITVEGVPGGNYITTAAQKNMIVSFFPGKIKLFEYDYAQKNMMVREMTFTVNKTKDTLFVPDPSGAKTDAISYKWSKDTLFLTTPDKKIQSLIPYSGAVPYPDWSGAVIDTSKQLNLPYGAWRMKTAAGEELLMVSKDMMKVLSYQPADSSMTEMTLPFTASAKGDTLFVVQKTGTDTVLWKINSTAAGKTVLFSTSKWKKEYFMHTGSIPPADWKLKKQIIDTAFVNLPFGSWRGKTPNGEEILFIDKGMMKSLIYNAVDSTMFDSSVTFTPSPKGDTLFVQTKAGIEPVTWSITPTASGKLLKLVTSKGVKEYAMYTGPVPPTEWILKGRIIDTAFVNLPFGSWRGKTPNGEEILFIDKNMMKSLMYNPMDSTMFESFMSFSSSAKGDTLFVKTSSGIEPVTWSITPTASGKLLKLVTSKGVKEYAMYTGPVPPAEWILKGRIIDTAFVNLPFGSWRGKTPNGEEILFIDKGMMKSLVYNAFDSTMFDSSVNYTPSIKGDTLFVQTKNGIEPVTWSITPTASGKLLKLATSKGVKEYAMYTGPVPPAEWILKGRIIDTAFVNLPFGSWRGKSPNGEEILFVDKNMMKSLMYNPMDSTMSESFMNFTASAKGDTLYVQTSSGIEPVTWSITPTTSGKLLKMAAPKGVREYVSYMGPVPPAEWILKPKVF